MQRPDGEVAYRLLEDVGAEGSAAIAAAADRLSRWLGDARIALRGRRRSPLEK